MSADQIHFFLHLRNQIKLYHWQTRVYARHIATDQILERLEKHMDSFVEVYIGKYGRSRVAGKNTEITVHNMTEAGASRMLQAALRYLQGPLSRSLKEEDHDLFALRDDLMEDVHQLAYLFTLH